ncbi:putative membrane protein [Caminicella sporogenes DSM 14501]|uniref:Putative membrane protein n=1 Tax=Caminicella sporogenes DSM 14501 TaxID=1121266 RepID=A0A1M6T858_9FIRM|nr:phage holin family protein [Caminicella sporogenes]WIF94328.1 phage holin family protein [Caminicella sporogenes]SHK53143.1 putative membrane protein [Caminicella sporogenes DSM 14501]
MKKFILRWLSSAVSIYIIAKLFENIYISGFIVALWAAVILGIANTIVKPMLIILTLPINIVSLGLFTFVVNGLILKLSAGIVPGFRVNGLFGAIIASIVLSLLNLIITSVFGISED